MSRLEHMNEIIEISCWNNLLGIRSPRIAGLQRVNTIILLKRTWGQKLKI